MGKGNGSQKDTDIMKVREYCGKNKGNNGEEVSCNLKMESIGNPNELDVEYERKKFLS